MLIKSSMESEELAYDTANIVYKNVGPTYNGWWMKEGYGQGYSWVMAEHNDYSVRLFFEFMDTGFCYVKVHFTNGAAYEDLVAYSWNYAKESPEYPFEGTQNRVRDFLDNFFEAGGGMDMLREKYENGHNGYDVDKFLSSAKKLVKSSLENDSSDLKNKMESMSGEDIVKGIKKTIRRNQKPMLGIKYNVLDQNGGVVGTPMSYEDACDLADDIDGEVVPVYSSRRTIKSSDANCTYEEYQGNRFNLDEYLPWLDDNKINRELAGYFGKDKIEKFYNIVGNAKIVFDGYRIKLSYSEYPDLYYYVKSNNGCYELHLVNNQGWDSTVVRKNHRFGPDYFLDEMRKVLPDNIESSFVAGKTENGQKLYYCEDGQYYAEEDYTRPSIKVFDNEVDAKKIAKRSKNGFATPLEVE